MFTGIIEDKGRIINVQHRGPGRRLAVAIPPGLTEIRLGDSINVNGACLTVVAVRGNQIEVDLSSETIQRTTLKDLRVGDEVNLERALKLGDRLGGHIVTGHVDGIGTIVDRRTEAEFVRLRIRIPSFLTRYVVEKGSIAIDGTSLTINECRGDEIEIALIPYTLEKTTLNSKMVGDLVNIEADIVGKYVEKLMDRRSQQELDLSFLKEHGFLKEE